jgi:AmpD protein
VNRGIPEGARLTLAPLTLAPDGWLEPHPSVALRPSPNHDARPGDEAPSLLVLHNISLPPGVFDGDSIVDFFLNRLDYAADPWFENIRDVRVSAHFLIRRDGAIVQFVSTCARAWHAGVSHLGGRDCCNDFSIGVEIEGTDLLPYTDAQYASLRDLAAALCARHPIAQVRGHEHIAPGRKTDPGPAFDWARFGREGGWAAAQLPGDGSGPLRRA